MPNFTSPDQEFCIYDYSGRMIFRKKMNAQESELTIPASGNIFSEGFYLFRINTSRGILSGKMEVLNR